MFRSRFSFVVQFFLSTNEIDILIRKRCLEVFYYANSRCSNPQNRRKGKCKICTELREHRFFEPVSEPAHKHFVKIRVKLLVYVNRIITAQISSTRAKSCVSNSVYFKSFCTNFEIFRFLLTNHDDYIFYKKNVLNLLVYDMSFEYFSFSFTNAKSCSKVLHRVKNLFVTSCIPVIIPNFIKYHIIADAYKISVLNRPFSSIIIDF